MKEREPLHSKFCLILMRLFIKMSMYLCTYKDLKYNHSQLFYIWHSTHSNILMIEIRCCIQSRCFNILVIRDITMFLNVIIESICELVISPHPRQVDLFFDLSYNRTAWYPLCESFSIKPVPLFISFVRGKHKPTHRNYPVILLYMVQRHMFQLHLTVLPSHPF